MRHALAFSGVSKRYGRNGIRALDEMSFSVPQGSICGFIGPNGAGKTTTFSVVSGYLKPDEGEINVLGQAGFDPFALKGRLQVLPQDAELGTQHTPRELVAHLARLGGLGRREALDAAEKTLRDMRLEDRMNARIGTLSHGMRRRVAVATALVGRPELVLLDEPTAGLDPVQAQSLREVISRSRGTRTMVISSHNLDELERICDWVVMVDAGRCVRQGTVAEVTGRQSHVTWVLGPGHVPLEAIRQEMPHHRFSLEERTLHETIRAEGDADASSIRIAALLAEHGVAIREVRRGQSLQQTFLNDARDLPGTQR